MIWLIFLLLIHQESFAQSLLKEAQLIIEKHKIQNYDFDKLEEGALKGLVSSIDPYSYYFTKSEAQTLDQKLSGKFYGLGVEIAKVKEGALILNLYRGSGAAEAGLQPQDIITELDGEKISSKDLDFIRSLILGPSGSKIRVTVRREGERREFVVTRKLIKISPEVKKFHSTLYIKIQSFNSGLTKAIEKILLQETFQSLILDLRSNPGGLLDEALSLTELFLPRNKILVFIQEKNNIQKFISQKNDLLAGKNLILLVNGFSASASELFAAALQDHKRALLVGQKTFGKGSVQSRIKLSKGLLKLTTALYFSPLGRKIDQKGLEPDLWVEEENKMLERALDLLVVKDFYSNKELVQPLQ